MMNEMMGKVGCEDKAEMMDSMMKDMMSKMMGKMDMEEMYPKCTKMMANKIPKEKRVQMIPKIVKSIVENGSENISKEQKNDTALDIIEKRYVKFFDTNGI